MSVFGRRTATLCVLFLLPTFASSYARALSLQSEPAIENLSIDSSQQGVDATLIANADVRYTYFLLSGPRLVVDLHGAENRLGFSQRSIGEGGVTQVRAAPFRDATRDVTRIVFDLEEGTSYRVVKDAPGRIRVSFEGATTVAPIQDVAAAPTQDVAAAPMGDSESALSDEGIPNIPEDSLPADVAPQLEADAGDGVLVPLSDSDLAGPGSSEPPSSVPIQLASLVPAAGFPTELPPATPEREALEELAVVEPPQSEVAPQEAGETESPASSDVLNSFLSPSSSAAAPSIAEGEPFPEPVLAELEGPAGPAEPTLTTQVVSPIPVPNYTGEIYDFDLRDVALLDFFRTISDLSGLNVILDPNIPNQGLTMTLYQVPWDQALDIVLRNYNLAWELNGNVLRIASQDTLQQEEARRLEYRELQEQNGPLVNNTYVLSYTTAGTAAVLVEGLLTDRGTVVPVQERNALIVTDIENRFDSIARMIDFLDTPSQQVEIEARLLQANKTFRRDLGNQLGAIFNNTGSNIVTGVPTLPSPFERVPPPAATAAGSTGALPLIADFSVAAPTAGLSFLLGVGGDVLLDNIIQVAETRGTARLLSRPNVVVQNNEPAIIEQGTQIPVQTNVNNTITVQFQQFALRLEVTPQITEEGTILLNAVIENSTPDFSQQVDGIPSIATQRAQTRVLIDDGATAMVGGILIDSDSVNVSQVPGLGNIPILGNLFKSTSTIKSTSELLFFVTARIKSADTLDFLTEAGAAGLSADFAEELLALEPPEGILEDTPELAGPDFTNR